MPMWMGQKTAINRIIMSKMANRYFFSLSFHDLMIRIDLTSAEKLHVFYRRGAEVKLAH